MTSLFSSAQRLCIIIDDVYDNNVILKSNKSIVKVKKSNFKSLIK